MEERFEQSTDKAFARYVSIAKGSVGELRGHLRRAKRKNYITAEELKVRDELADTLGKMLGGFIKYLHRSDFRDGGRYLGGSGGDEKADTARGTNE